MPTFNFDISAVDEMNQINYTMREFRRSNFLSERAVKMKSNLSFKPVINFIRQLSSRSMEENQKKERKKKSTRKVFQVGNGLNRITRILNSRASKSGKPRPIIIVPNEIIKGNLNLINAKHFFTKNVFQNVIEIKNENQKNPRLKDVLYLNVHSKRLICDIFPSSLSGESFSFEIWDDLRFVKQKNRIDSVVAIFIKVHFFSL